MKKPIVISSDRFLPDETETVKELFDSGMEVFHLRKPGASDWEVGEMIEQIPSQYHEKVVLHDHFYLTRDYGLKGVHFNTRHPYNRSDVHLFDVDKSASCHSMEDIELMDEVIPDLKYVFLSPVFDSISKENYPAAFNELELTNDLKSLKNMMKINIIALGGIKAENIKKCGELGFDGVAVLGSIWNTENPVESYLKIEKACQ